MEVTYRYPTTDVKTITVDEADVASLNDALRECFINRLLVIGLAHPYLDYEVKLVEMCKKYGVNNESKLEVHNFFGALLGVQ